MKADRVTVLVLNKIEVLDKLLDELYNAGVMGATAIHSMGMARALADKEYGHIISSLRIFLSHDKHENKTIFSVCDEEADVKFREAVHRVVGDLSQPNTGILFSVPLLYAEGINKLKKED